MGCFSFLYLLPLRTTHRLISDRKGHMDEETKAESTFLLEMSFHVFKVNFLPFSDTHKHGHTETAVSAKSLFY